MILTGSEIRKQVENGNIIIDPFNESMLTTNSYDFRLGNTLKLYKDLELDVKCNNEIIEITIPNDGLVLQPDKIYLGHTVEIIGSNKYVPIIRGKSSTGRIGLFVHITADLIDIGSVNQYTLMLHAVQPLKIYPGMLIGQVTFWTVDGKINSLYTGKYKGLMGPQHSQIYRDFDESNTQTQ